MHVIITYINYIPAAHASSVCVTDETPALHAGGYARL